MSNIIYGVSSSYDGLTSQGDREDITAFLNRKMKEKTLKKHEDEKGDNVHVLVRQFYSQLAHTGKVYHGEKTEGAELVVRASGEHCTSCAKKEDDYTKKGVSAELSANTELNQMLMKKRIEYSTRHLFLENGKKKSLEPANVVKGDISESVMTNESHITQDELPEIKMLTDSAALSVIQHVNQREINQNILPGEKASSPSSGQPADIKTLFQEATPLTSIARKLVFHFQTWEKEAFVNIFPQSGGVTRLQPSDASVEQRLASHWSSGDPQRWYLSSEGDDRRGHQPQKNSEDEEI
ncbi:SpaN/EivJ family type III secretion system needle length determinant [Citrobacter portucalensis]|uniref:SpaN/EivJ family type III secretion system needle length determinant n=1 Tax=Citrobacter portucalensis TaxID=1639133 RepID=UPI001EB18E2B|nr:type III secretion system needle length determinant, SpaN/EivJ family [Citrobacter portucalensis]EDS3841749.1 hypothetical protein [Salmonella enterica]WNI88030.1 type III secretion system needle length determinant, SpaN/EivJ family [Citrobacter portucalensis]